MAFSKGIEFKSIYRGDLSGLKRDLTKLDAHRTRLKNSPFYIPVRLDMGHIKSDLAKIEKQVKQSMASQTRAAASGTQTASGLHVPPEALKSYDELRKKQESLIKSRRLLDKSGNEKSRTEDHFLGDGKTQQKLFKTNKKGLSEFKGSIEQNTQRAALFRKELRAIESDHGNSFSKALGAKDAIGQIDALQGKIEDMQTLLQKPEYQALGNEKDFQRAHDSLSRTEQRLSGLTATKDQKREERNSNQTLERAERSMGHKIKANKLEEAHARKIENTKDRETQVNRILNERIKILERYRNRFRQIDALAQKRGASGIADKAFKKADQTQSKIDQIGIDRQRGASRASVDARRNALQGQLNDVQARARHELAINKQLQRRAKQLSSNKRQQQQINRLLADRQKIHLRLGTSLAAIEGRALSQGFSGIASNAHSARANSSRAAILDTQRFAAATQASGHALNFHTSNLLRNAATFAKWHAPMQLVLGVIQAFTSGVEGMVKVDRQFATLRAVFRGTAEEAQMLKKDTIDLGIAQGQTAETSMDAAIRWSRLGLTRTQVLEQVQTSLVGANVAEMSAADTAERLAAIYATWNLRLSETAGVLDTLNAISNRYNATNKGMLDGMVAGGAVAKQAGQDLREYAALLSVGESSGFKGREIGNTTKFVFQRIRRPETLEKLKNQLDIDLTNPNGQIKDMSQVMRELAEIYPGLSKSQQTLLLDITAGSRQAARFAVLLEGQRESQIRAAESAFDTGSALRENEKILESMEAHLNALKSSWIELFVTLGDTGILTALTQSLMIVTDNLRDMSDMIQIGAEGFDKMQQSASKLPGMKFLKERAGIMDDSPRIKLRNRAARSAFKDPLSGFSPYIPNFIENPARNFLGLNKTSNLSGAAGSATKNQIEARLAELQSKFGNSDGGIGKGTGGLFDPKAQIQALENALREFETGAIAGEVQTVGRELENLRSKADGIRRGEAVFLSLAKALKTGTEPSEKLNKEWKQAAGLLNNLNNGSTLFAQNYGKISQLINSGESGSASELISELSKGFKAEAPQIQKQFIEAQKVASDKLKKSLSDLEKQQLKISEGFAGLEDSEAIQAQRDKLEDLNDKMKETLDTILSVDAALAKAEETTFLDANQIANINKHLDKTMQSIEVITNALAGLSIQGADSPDRAFNRKIEAAGLNTQQLKKTRALTKEGLDIKRDEAKELDKLHTRLTVRDKSLKVGDGQTVSKKNLDQLKFIDELPFAVDDLEKKTGQRFNKDTKISTLADKAEEMTNAKRAEIEADREALEILDRRIKLEDERRAKIEETAAIEREAARFKESFDQGAQDASINARNFLIGTNDTDKKINQSRGLLNLNPAHINVDDSSANDILSKRAAFLQNEATITANILSLRQRDADIHATIASTKDRIKEAEEAQTKELSKRLALASREDQLRAAMATAATKDGPLSLQEFSFLSQGTRNAVNNLSPQQVNGLGSAREKIAQENNKLVEEQKRISGALAGLVPGLQDFKNQIDIFTKNNPLNASNSGIQGKALQNAFGAQKPSDVVINAGSIHVDVSEQFGRFTEEITRNVIQRVDEKLTTISDHVSSLMEASEETNPGDFTP